MSSLWPHTEDSSRQSVTYHLFRIIKNINRGVEKTTNRGSPKRFVYAYGDGYPVEVLSVEIAKVEYRGLGLSHLHTS